jgi:transposase
MCDGCGGTLWSMNKKKWVVELTETERMSLTMLIASGHASARKLAHARILLKADVAEEEAGWEDDVIAQALEVSRPTVERVRKRFVTEGLEAALNHRHPKNHRPRRLDGEQEAHLIALTCGATPAGRERWTLRLLAATMVELEYVDTLSYETVRATLKKTHSSLG